MNLFVHAYVYACMSLACYINLPFICCSKKKIIDFHLHFCSIFPDYISHNEMMRCVCAREFHFFDFKIISFDLYLFHIQFLGTAIFSVIIYTITSQPLEMFRFWMFLAICVAITIVGQSIGLMVGAWFDVTVRIFLKCNDDMKISLVLIPFIFLCCFSFSFHLKNGTFLAPTLTIPMMMFAGFGVTLRDLPSYMRWGSHISFMRYGLEGFVGAIFGEGRKTLNCNAIYCHYRWAWEKLLPSFFSPMSWHIYLF